MIKIKSYRYLLLLLVLGVNVLKAQNAVELLQKMDKLMSAPKDKQAVVKIILTDKSGKEKIREAVLKEKGRFKRLYRYTKPEKQAGIATLSLPNDIMWLYMPAFAKPIRITLLSKSQTFTGTDFSYEDMSGKSYSERYTPKIIESKNKDVYRIELVPISKKSKYSKILLSINKTHSYPVKMEYYNRKNIHSKDATYKYENKDNYWYAKEVLMVDLRKEHSTGIFMSEIVFDKGIDDEVFLVENLKQ
jgi:outer membrane lipoprotein-sorting protein